MNGSNTMNFISINLMKITVVGHYKDVFAISILEVRYSLLLLISKVTLKLRIAAPIAKQLLEQCFEQAFG